MTKLEWSSADEAWTASLASPHFEALEIRVLTDGESTPPTETQLKSVALIEQIAEKGLPSTKKLARKYAKEYLGPNEVEDMEDEDLAIEVHSAVAPRLRETNSAYVIFVGNSDIDFEHGVAVLCKDSVKFAVAHSDIAYDDYYFTMHTAGESRLLVDSTTGVVDKSLVERADLTTLDKQEIRTTLESVKAAPETKAGFDEQRLYGALVIAARHDMKELTSLIAVVEEKGWHGPRGWIPNHSYGAGLRPEIRSATYKLNEDRRFAELALRRLGQTPRGFGQYDFGIGTKAMSNDLKATQIKKLSTEHTSGQVIELLGPPDYILSAVEDAPEKPSAHRKRKWVDAWRYDLGGEFNYSILILWTDDGKIEAVQEISPGLWNKKGVFENRSETVGADGGFNGIHLYGNRFLGRMQNVLEMRNK